MPSLPTLVVFASAALVLLVIPGPAVLFIVTRSSAHGSRAGLVSVGGVHTASVVHVLAAVAGVSAVLAASATAFTFVKIAGAAYLMWMGVRVLRGRAAASSPTSDPSSRRLFAQAFTVNLLNPKIALFFLAFLPQFVRPGAGPVWLQTLVLGFVFIALGLVSDSTYALTAAGLARRLRTRPRHHPVGRIVEGTTLIGLGITSLAFAHRPSTPSRA
jgi:threonine/homoserine/homoserine lactone efflux protein